MNRRAVITSVCTAAPAMLVFSGGAQSKSAGASAARFLGSPGDGRSLKETGDAIRAAFARGDVEGILAYHHPEVIKALSYQNYIVGLDALRTAMRGTLQSFNLEFVENKVESTLFQSGTAVEESLFAIKSTPKSGGASSVFKGRSMVVYVRYAASPTGWASIREVVQPAT
jgi:ketosteroid isomerase-like protein